MNIASLIVFFLWAALLVWAEGDLKLDVRRLKDMYHKEGSTLYNFTKEDCTFFVKWKKFTVQSGEEKRLIITASYGGRDLSHYSMPQFTINANDTDDTLKKRLQDNIKLEGFFDFQKKQIYADQFFIVKYLQTSRSEDGIWWCDVYKFYKTFRTETYDYTQDDKCVYIENGMEAMLDPLYNSVISDSQDQPLRTTNWEKCNDTSKTICTDQFTGIKINAELWCDRRNPAAGPLGYKILLQYDSTVLKSYTLSNSEKLKLDQNTTKACKLFNFAINDGGNDVFVQFMNKPDVRKNKWEYKCHWYRRQSGAVITGSYKRYDKIIGESWFNEYKAYRNYQP